MPPFLAQGMCSGFRDSHNLAWKLDLVLQGKASERLLDTYQSEREPHVRFITEKAIALGRVQTMRDPQRARERDETMLAQRRANKKLDKLRYPGLTNGFAEGNGAFFPQGSVRSGDCEDLFDTIVGPDLCIVASSEGALSGLSSEQISAWQDIGGKIAVVSSGSDFGSLIDLRGVYSSWFRENDAIAAIVRPDWYLYGAAATAGELSELLSRLRTSLWA